MKNIIIIIGSILASAGLAIASPSARAADGSFCVSPTLTVTSRSDVPTTTYPQISTTMKFTCASATEYTIKQLSQAGWIIDNMGTSTISTTVSVNGSVVTTTQKIRYQFTIQK